MPSEAFGNIFRNEICITTKSGEQFRTIFEKNIRITSVKSKLSYLDPEWETYIMCEEISTIIIYCFRKNVELDCLTFANESLFYIESRHSCITFNACQIFKFQMKSYSTQTTIDFSLQPPILEIDIDIYQTIVKALCVSGLVYSKVKCNSYSGLEIATNRKQIFRTERIFEFRRDKTSCIGFYIGENLRCIQSYFEECTVGEHLVNISTLDKYSYTKLELKPAISRCEQCIVCREEAPDIIFPECWHMIVCSVCIRKMPGPVSCPSCRKKLTEYRQVYISSI